MKKFLSCIILALMLSGFAINTFAYEANEKIPVLLYHMIDINLEGTDTTVTITPETLKSHLMALKQNGFNTITFTDYYNYVTYNTPLPNKPVLISFDDGYLSNYTYLYPMLKQLDMKATIFIVASTVGKTPGVNPHFSWEQAKEMQDSGYVDIQSHTYSHGDVTLLNQSDLDFDLRYSKYLIEKNLNKECLYLAYPYGYNNEQTEQAAKNAGYILTAQVSNELSTPSEFPKVPIKRLTICAGVTAEKLISMI